MLSDMGGKEGRRHTDTSLNKEFKGKGCISIYLSIHPSIKTPARQIDWPHIPPRYNFMLTCL